MGKRTVYLDRTEEEYKAAARLLDMVYNVAHHTYNTRQRMGNSTYDFFDADTLEPLSIEQARSRWHTIWNHKR